MKHSDFSMGQKFQCGGRDWLVTDIGTRTIVAVELGKTQDWYGGPPYAVVEEVFDENDLPGCEPESSVGEEKAFYTQGSG